ncbi:MAG: hypothetical protein JXR32_02925 [Anaerolineaceae bacterium]|nr:hypothetical protein [Anaerolineaceae bacterium]
MRKVIGSFAGSNGVGIASFDDIREFYQLEPKFTALPGVWVCCGKRRSA